MGKLVYKLADFSFDFIPAPSEYNQIEALSSGCSVSLGTLQIEVHAPSGQALYVWGYHHQSTWRDVSLEAPIATRKGIVKIIPTMAFQDGVAQDLRGATDWVTLYDPKAGIIFVGESNSRHEGQATEFGSGMLAQICKGALLGLWLMPEFQ